MLRPCRSYLPLRSLESAIAGPVLLSQADAAILDPAAVRDPGALAAVLRHYPNPRQSRGVRLNAAHASRTIGPLATLLALAPDTIDLVILSGVGDPADVRNFAVTLQEIATVGSPPRLDVEVAERTAASTIGLIAAALGPGRGLHMADRPEEDPPGNADLCGVRLIDLGGQPGTLPGSFHGRFHGRWIAEPGEAATCNALFTPTIEQVRQARRVLGACAAAEEDSLPAVILDGRVVHLRSIRQAEQTLAVAAFL